MRDLETCLRRGVPAQPFGFPIADGFFVRLANATYHDYATCGAVMAEVWNRAIAQFDLDWAGPFVDDLFEYEPLGIESADGPDRPYAVTRYLPAARASLARLALPDPRRDGRMPARLEAIARLRARWGRDIVICNSVAAPFAGLTLLYGIDATMLAVYDDPGLLKRTMTFLEELAVAWGQALLAAGSDLIWLGDCSASSRFLSLDMYRDFALEPARRVTAALRDAGAKVIYHAGENKLNHLRAALDVGADVLSVESGIDLADVQRAIGGQTCLSGNLDGINLIWLKTPAEIEAEARRLVREVACRGGVIVNTGEGIPDQAPVANVAALLRAIREAWPGPRA